MHSPLLICDLDGTLVDSQPGILEALRQACFAVGIEPLRPLDGTLVGPPLDELLQNVTGLPAGKALDAARGHEPAADNPGTRGRDDRPTATTVAVRSINTLMVTLITNPSASGADSTKNTFCPCVSWFSVNWNREGKA
jgi:hypothetical protein